MGDFSDLWSRVRAAEASWEPDAFMSDPLIQDAAALEAATLNPVAAAATASPMAAAFIDIVTAAERGRLHASIDLDSIILSAAASQQVSGNLAARVCVQRFRLTISGDPTDVEAAYAARPRGCSWQICRWDRARPTSIPPVLEAAEYMYLPGGDIIVLLAGSPENPAEATSATKLWLFDVLGEHTYSGINRWTILPRALANVSCDYALRPIADVAANIEAHLGIAKCTICRVHSTNCELVGSLCESCAAIATRALESTHL